MSVRKDRWESETDLQKTPPNKFQLSYDTTDKEILQASNEDLSIALNDLGVIASDVLDESGYLVAQAFQHRYLIRQQIIRFNQDPVEHKCDLW